MTAAAPPEAAAAMEVSAGRLEPQVEALLAADPTLHLVDLTAVGGAGTDSPLRAVYQLRSAAGNRIRLTATGAGELPGLAHIWPAADWPEREMAGRFGMRIEGREDLRPLFPAPPAMVPGEMPPPPEGEVPIPDPSEATPFRLDLGARLRGGRIETATARPGRLHSGFERLAESRTWAQLPVLAESLNEQAPFVPGLAAILAAEALLGITPPAPVHLGAHAAGRDQPHRRPLRLAGQPGGARFRLVGPGPDRPGGGGVLSRRRQRQPLGHRHPAHRRDRRRRARRRRPLARRPGGRRRPAARRCPARHGGPPGLAPPLLRRRGSRRRRGPGRRGYGAGRPRRGHRPRRAAHRALPRLRGGPVRGAHGRLRRCRRAHAGSHRGDGGVPLHRPPVPGRRPRRTDPGPRGPPGRRCAPRSPPS